MIEKLKIFVRYIYMYQWYGVYLYTLIYILKKEQVSLKEYGLINIRANTFDNEIFNQIFIYKQYNLAVSGTINTVIDLGANNGMSALFFNNKYPEATIYAVEPDKNNFAALKRNVGDNPQIIAINKAIWKEEGFVNLDSGDSWTVKVDMNLGTNEVEAISLNTLIETYKISRVDLLKIDIETAEKEVFEADTSFLKSTKNIFIELHDWLRPGCSKAFFKSLDNFDYEYSINIENTIIKDLRHVVVC